MEGEKGKVDKTPGADVTDAAQLSWIFEFDVESDVYFFAYSYPYTYTDLQAYLHDLDKLNLP